MGAISKKTTKKKHNTNWYGFEDAIRDWIVKEVKFHTKVRLTIPVNHNGKPLDNRKKENLIQSNLTLVQDFSKLKQIQN